MFRRIYSFILALIIVFSFSVCTASAQQYVANVPEPQWSMNEYEAMKILAQQSPSVLSAEGYTTEEIQNIQNYEQIYIEHIESLNELDTSTLIKHGYTTDQINIIRNFSGSEEQAARVAAKLTLQMDVNDFHDDGDYTRGTVIYSWRWSGIPTLMMKDVIAVSWNNWIVENERSTLNYVNVNTGEFEYSGSAIFSKEKNDEQSEGCAHMFSLVQNDYYYAQTGNGSFVIRSDTHVRKDLSIYMTYGHSQITASWPELSIGIGGADGSIDLGFGVDLLYEISDLIVCP